MRLLKFKKRIDIDKTIGNFYIVTSHFGAYDPDGTHKDWTELHCGYNCDCKNCPASWSDWYGEDGDCGCYLAKLGEEYAPLWKCMLPKWAKKILIKLMFAREERRYRKMEKEMRQEEEEDE